MTYEEYVAEVKASHEVHSPGIEFTACGIRFWVPAPATFHTEMCLRGEETCSGIHVTAVGSSHNPDLVNCPDCLAARYS
jgi:hypothetical protein